jgi:hypothetical protein
MSEVDWHNLEEWHENGSYATQKARIPEHLRYSKVPNPMAFVERARHHTTRGRSKKERLLDVYWFTPPDPISYKENSFNGHIPKKKRIIYPPCLPKGRSKKPVEHKCLECGATFKAKRSDAVFCRPTCRKRSERRRKLSIGSKSQ